MGSDDDPSGVCVVLNVQLKESEIKITALSQEQELLIKHRHSVLQEASFWQSELAKAQERVVTLEASVGRAEEKAESLSEMASM